MKYKEIANRLGYRDESIVDIVSPEDFYAEHGIDYLFKILLRFEGDDFHHYITHKYYSKIKQQLRNEILTDLIITENKTSADDFTIKYKVGDCVYYDFQPFYITDMIDDIVSGVSDGMINSTAVGGIVPIGIKSTRATLEVRWAYDEIYKHEHLLPENMIMKGHIIFGKLEYLWRKLIDGENIRDELYTFKNNVIDSLKNKDYSMIDIDDDGKPENVFMKKETIIESSLKKLDELKSGEINTLNMKRIKF